MRIVLFSLLIQLASFGLAQADCVIELDRDQVEVVRGELRVDLGRLVRERCRGTDPRDLRLEQVRIRLDDDSRGRFGRGRDRNDDGRWRGDRGDRGDQITIYRFFNGRQHLMTADPRGGERLGYDQDEGARFSLYRDAGRNRAALFSCIVSNKNDRYLSREADCEGFSSEGLLGFIAEEPDRSNSRPLYRCYSRDARDHIATIDKDECVRAGYAVEKILGYVP